MNGNSLIAPECIARKAFLDPAIEAEFEEKGYVLIPVFLDPATINTLSELYMKFSPSASAGFHVTNWVKDDTYRSASHEKISSILSERLKTILDNYKPVLGCFAVKEPGHDNTMGLHQDWSVTDETRFYGLSAWIPLVDVATDSGALRILKGSHRLFRNIRGQKIENQLDAIPADIVNRYLTTIPMKAGDLLLLHHRIVHSSGPAVHRRIAAMTAVIPREAEVRHYLSDVSDDRGKGIRVYNCPDDFYVHFDIDSMPQAELETSATEQTDYVVTGQMITDHYSK